ncbi:hypothetical protein EW146_g5579 [Bondarzewia mesenterica]|uniref:G-protein coupled receptors family 1 profile domain-containing protein n=1 Tax=Bondarzewia mesenterica TaxID=1095465 RepID=A0A4S4LR05_9AGAM|nr:hypothetical protein EW146_g5579 [Bondarzewia mesenterica]
MSNSSYIAPDGNVVLTRLAYTVAESRGIITLIVVSCISALAVAGLLTALTISAFNTRSSSNPNLFVRTHVVVYFVCLLTCDLLQAIGAIMNVAWAQRMSVGVGALCTAQGIIKHIADLGIAIWSLVIAFHVFGILFFCLPLKRYAMWCTLIGTWSLIATLVITGPATLDTAKRGPFCNLGYMIMFISASVSFVLYMLVFLKLRGNVIVHGIHIRFRMHHGTPSWRGTEKDQQNGYIMVVARQMLLYPIAYTIIILPIAAARFSAWFKHDVPFSVTVFCDAIYLLSGTANTVLFSSTRRILPPRSIIPKFLISKPRLVESAAVASGDTDPYYGSAMSEAQSITIDPEMEKGEVDNPFEVAPAMTVSACGRPKEMTGSDRDQSGRSSSAWRLNVENDLQADADAVVLTEAGILKRIYSPDADSDSDAGSISESSDFFDVDVSGEPMRHATPLPHLPRSPKPQDEDDGSERSLRRVSATPTAFIDLYSGR